MYNETIRNKTYHEPQSSYFVVYDTLLCISWYVLILIVSFTPKTAVLFPGGNVTFMCNNSNNFWIVDDVGRRLDDSEVERIDGLSVIDDGDDAMLFITQSDNNTLYGCGIFLDTFILDTGILYVAGTYVCIYSTYMHMSILLLILRVITLIINYTVHTITPM